MGLKSPACGFLWFSVTAVVMKILSPQTIGCDHPAPGSATFQAMFLSAPHSAGRFFAVARPLLWGPRHWGQFCPIAQFVTISIAQLVASAVSKHIRLIKVLLNKFLVIIVRSRTKILKLLGYIALDYFQSGHY
jgi:hypothetical protein